MPLRPGYQNVQRKILIMGLPGAGKTTLATALAPLLNAVVFNADAVRANLSRDLGFSHEDRVEHARRMGWMCDRVVEAGGTVIADFICPTPETRAAFGEAFIDLGRPHRGGPVRGHQPDVRAARAVRHGRQGRRNAAMLGRAGSAAAAPGLRSAEADGTVHRALSAVSCRPSTPDRGRTAARRTGLHRGARHPRADDKNPLPFFAVKQRIEAALSALCGPLRGGAAAQHHPRVLRPRRRLQRRAHRARRGHRENLRDENPPAHITPGQP